MGTRFFDNYMRTFVEDLIRMKLEFQRFPFKILMTKKITKGNERGEEGGRDLEV